MNIDCVIYRCARQDEMYVYLREDLSSQALPPELLARTGSLQQVMRLTLDPQRTLARVDVHAVLEKLGSQGWYLQMPPQGMLRGYMNDAD